MKMRLLLRLRLVLVAAALAAPALAGAAPRPAEGTPATARALPGKPTGPIAVEYRLAEQPVVGVALAIDVTARVQAAAGSLAIEANPSAPRSVLVTPPTLVKAGDGVYSWRITVVPLTAEAGYLSVIVEGVVDGVAQARSVTIPLRSRAPAAASAPAAAAPAAETLIALPVEESP
jgi:hypothetical protein